MAFPVSPVNNQTTVVNNLTYQYSTATNAWTRVSGTQTSVSIPGLIITNTTASTSTTTGALTVAGGLGVAGSVYVGGNVITTGTVSAGGIRSTTTSTAPSNPGVGDLWYWTTNDTLLRYTYDGTSYYWVDISGPTTGFVSTASGGGGSSGYTLNYLLVGGGGGGGSSGGGGGGAGGVWTGTMLVSSPGTTYSITIGGGGAKNCLLRLPGTNTTASFTTTVAFGGGAGIYTPTCGIGAGSGGSGGGGHSPLGGPGGAGTPGQGNAGSNYLSGGGAGGIGTCQAGGIGSGSWTNIIQVTGFGQNVTGTFYIAGGGGGYNPGAPSLGGAVGGFGGGGSSSMKYTFGNGQKGLPNTGGGGGGGGPGCPPARCGASGGSGFAVIWYTAPVMQGSGGSVYSIYPGVTTATTWVHAFAATGTYIA